jgi:uncharacterized protein
MSGNGTKQLIVMLAHNANGDRASVAFKIATGALTKGMQVAVFLTSDGVELGRAGACNHVHVEPFPELALRIDEFIAQGGRLWTCTHCFGHRNMRLDETVEGSEVTDGERLIEWLAAGAATVCL